MKKYILIAFLLVLIPVMALGGQITLEWDDNNPPEALVMGYALFDKHYQSNAYVVPKWTGTEQTCTITVQDDRETDFIVRAWRYSIVDIDGNKTVEWSEDSNEFAFIPNAGGIDPPLNLRQRIIQAIKDWIKRWRG